ncbi:MAG TPA: isochorismatase family cysteine hydrolase [Rudaea sp.]|jgi:nicotinamidase-related amidase|nr:isochorismatase family cysteine hydrolase [Rudaea sp.]
MKSKRTRSKSALLLVDLINTWAMKDGRFLLRNTVIALPRIVALKARAMEAGLPVIYVNDNFGQWRSDFAAVVRHAMRTSDDAAMIAEQLAPRPDDYFVLKPRHSGFYETALELLLEELGIERLVIAGVAGDQCVLATATDALLRKFSVHIPGDVIVCKTAARTRAIKRHFKEAMDIPVTDSNRLRLR